MSKLGCVCGNIIVDQTDNIPYKAMFIRDQDREKYWGYADDVASFIDAIQTGQRDSWIRKYFSESYPTDINNSSIVFDIISSFERKFKSDIFQCVNCGRLKVEVNKTDVFSSFIPEDDKYKEILKGIG